MGDMGDKMTWENLSTVGIHSSATEHVVKKELADYTRHVLMNLVQ